jgi:competence protein ComEA
MQNPLDDLLTQGEQKLLLTFCAVFGLGLLLMMIGWTPARAQAKQEANLSLEQAVEKDHIVQIDIRIASKVELMQLKGIGAKRAEDIISFRERNPFTSVYDLKKVKGIGDKTFQNLLPHLIVFGDDAKPNTVSSAESEVSSTPKPQPDKDAPVNLNTASLTELMSLDGIGEVKAKAIIEYRDINGRFNTIEDFTKVKGIGAKTLEKNRSRLRI